MKFSLRHQSAGKLYPYLEVLSHTMYWGFFRKVHLHNIADVPSDKPVLLAANHPTAFIDPCLLCSYVHPPIYNMTRGDIFRQPFFRKLMESINMFPIYRSRDGYKERDRNDEVFDYCIGKLYEKRVVTIYVEGEHHLEKRVRPAHKGIARIAFGAYEQHRLDDLQIIPAGCNYVYGDRPRDEGMVNIGAPLFVKDYWDDYLRDPAVAIQRLCTDIEKALKSVCYHVASPDDDALAEQWLTLQRSLRPDTSILPVTHNDGRFFQGKAILDYLNTLSGIEKNELREKTTTYFKNLENAGLEDGALVNRNWGRPSKWLFFVTCFLPFLIGFLSSRPVVFLGKYLADRKVTKREFYSSVRMGVAFLAGVPYYFLLLLICVFTWNPFWIALGLSLPLLGWFSNYYAEEWARWKAARKAAGSDLREDLLKMRQELVSAVMPEMQN